MGADIGADDEDWFEFASGPQPRAPKGSAIGGQWVGKGAGDKGGKYLVDSIKDRDDREIDQKALTEGNTHKANKAYTEFHKTSSKWHEDLTVEEQELLSSYQNYGHGNINSALRSGAIGEHTKDIQTLDKILENSETPVAMTVMRGLHQPISLSERTHFRGIAKQYEDSVGQIVHDKAFASTTLSSSIAKKFSDTGGGLSGGPAIFIKADIPKGYRGAALLGGRVFGGTADYSKKGELEVLIKREAPMRIKAVRKVGRVIVVEGEYV